MKLRAARYIVVVLAVNLRSISAADQNSMNETGHPLENVTSAFKTDMKIDYHFKWSAVNPEGINEEKFQDLREKELQFFSAYLGVVRTQYNMQLASMNETLMKILKAMADRTSEVKARVELLNKDMSNQSALLNRELKEQVALVMTVMTNQFSAVTQEIMLVKQQVQNLTIEPRGV